MKYHVHAMERANLRNKKLKLIPNVGYCTILIINNEATLSFQSRCQKNALAGRVDNIGQQGQNIYVKPAHI